MGYYTRVLGTQDPDIHINELITALTEKGLMAKFGYDPDEQPGKWTVLDITNKEGETLVQIERNPVAEGTLGQEELDEFKEEMEDAQPASAVKWLIKYFDKVQVIYAFKMLTAAFEDGNFEIADSIKTTIWNKTGGILQADDEGFSNEEGYHILWQFSDDVTGEWSCAVKNWQGNWQSFTMDLGDTTQREEFKSGKVPEKATRL